MATVLLVRHGETTWNHERRIQGWAPAPLSERGRDQAMVAGDYLAEECEVDRVVASDLRRTRETARHVLAALGDVPYRFDPGWRERNFGVYQGMHYEELFETHPEYALSEVGYAAAETTPEGGESILETRERVQEAYSRLLGDLDADETVAVVTHGGPVRIIVGAVASLDVVECVLEVDVPNCSGTEIDADEPQEVVRLGDRIDGAPEEDRKRGIR